MLIYICIIVTLILLILLGVITLFGYSAYKMNLKKNKNWKGIKKNVR